MKIGINAAGVVARGTSLRGIVAHAAAAESDGFASYWMPQMAVPDALTAIAAMGTATSTIEIGTAVVPIWPRHPLMLAGQVLTTQEAVDNRLVLGIGLAHKGIVESTFKIPFQAMASQMDDYLSVLLPALADRSVKFTGDHWSGEDDLSGSCRDVVSPPVLLAAMGPRMLRMAGERAHGTILWLSGALTIAHTIRPALEDAAASADRPLPRIVAGLPVCVTTDPERARRRIGRALAAYEGFASYRAVLDLEGVEGPADVALVGTPDDIEAGLAALAEAGVTDFAATEFGTDPDEILATRAALMVAASRSADTDAEVIQIRS
jgi:5,10-methylenetetrahydromethanopterin reductase